MTARFVSGVRSNNNSRAHGARIIAYFRCQTHNPRARDFLGDCDDSFGDLVPPELSMRTICLARFAGLDAKHNAARQKAPNVTPSCASASFRPFHRAPA
jgi:hypothetical protein